MNHFNNSKYIFIKLYYSLNFAVIFINNRTDRTKDRAFSLTISNVSQIKSSLTGSSNIIFSEIEFSALSSSRDSTAIYTRNLSLLLLTSLITLERRPLFNANLRCIRFSHVKTSLLSKLDQIEVWSGTIRKAPAFK